MQERTPPQAEPSSAALGAPSPTGLYGAVLGIDGLAAVAGPGLLRRVRHHDAVFTIDAEDEIGIVLSLSEAHRVTRCSAGRSVADAPRVGAITLLPPGSPAHFSIVGPARALMLRLPWQALAGWLAEDHEVDAGRFTLLPRLHADDPVLARLLYQAASGGAEGHESAMRAIAARLLDRHAAGTSVPAGRASRGGLPPARLRRVLDRIEAEIHAPLTLATLAAEAGMSPFHFARAFQRTTGTPPHRYLIRRRVERAVLLSARPGLTVAEAATGAGFAHASHLARHMRRETGLAPSAFRSAVLP